MVELPDLAVYAVWGLGPVIAGSLILVTVLVLLPMLFATPGGPEARLSTPMRWVLYQGSAFVLLLGLQLYLFSGATDDGFVFAIANPATAAFLGANYISVACIGFIAARQRHWSFARIACPCALGFTIMMLFASLQGFCYVFTDRPISWIWFLVYALVPVQMTLAWLAQAAEHIRDGAGGSTVDQAVPIVLRVVFAGLAAVLIWAGFRLVFAGSDSLDWLPLDLSGPFWSDWSGAGGDEPEMSAGTPAQMEVYAGVWLLSLAIFHVHAALERDLMRLRPIFPAMVLWGLLQGLVMVRFAEAMRWDQPATWAWLMILVVSVGAGWIGLRRTGGMAGLAVRL